MSIRVAVADDHPALLAGMEHLLGRAEGIQLLGALADSSELVGLLSHTQCDVAVVDFSMPGGQFGDGLSLLRLLRQRFTGLRVVTLTALENVDVLRALVKLGAAGVVSKADDLAHVIHSIVEAQRGRLYLSPRIAQLLGDVDADEDTAPIAALSKREAEVMRLFAEGLSVTEIAQRAGRSAKTISAQKASAMKKLGLRNDADIFNYAQAHGLVPSAQYSQRSANDE